MKKILLVDDEPDILVILEKGLEREGDYEVDSYDDPAEALLNFKPYHYDLLLLDIKMPEMNGYELYDRLRKFDQRAQVCFLTAFESSSYIDGLKKRFPEIKDDCYIHKPITIQNLLGRVNRLLKD
jgi:DNA-binding response OmpR family regulator